MMCKILRISRDSYYKRLRRRQTQCGQGAVALELVGEIRREQPRIGIKKLYHKLKPELTKRGVMIGRDRFISVLREKRMLIKPKRRYQRTTYSRHQYAVAPNLVKYMSVEKPKQILVSDITYITLRDSFAYLYLVTDLYSRKIVGYHLSKDLTHHSALIALDNAILEHGELRGAVHHSDRGCQYCCHEYLKFLKTHGIIPSMTDESHCYQNAVAERVNGILKDEFNLDSTFNSFQDALAQTNYAVHVYNKKRTHWSLGLMTPQEIYDKAA